MQTSVSELTDLTDATVASIIARQVAARPDCPAIVTSGNVVAYAALGEQIATFGAGLRNNDLTCSARVAVMLPDGPELAVSIVAVACYATAVPLNPRLTEAELDDLFAMLRIDAVVVSDRIDRPVREIATRHGARLLEVRYGKFGAVEIADSRAVPMSVLVGDETAPSEIVQPDAPAIILRTSATTGKSKLVPVTHRNLVITADKRKSWFDFTPNDRSLCATQLHYGQALKGVLFTPLLLGGSVADHRERYGMARLFVDGIPRCTNRHLSARSPRAANSGIPLRTIGLQAAKDADS